MTEVKIYTDGSARGNPDGPGGYGVVMQTRNILQMPLTKTGSAAGSPKAGTGAKADR